MGDKGSMTRFLTYSPEQSYLLPPNVGEVLGGDHVCFFVHEVVERLDLSRFLEAYSEEGGRLYHPALMLKVWLYAYVLGMTSARRLEQRIREDLAFRYLAGGGQPDYWALNEFRRRPGRGIKDVFVQVLETAQKLGLGRLGTVAIDSTRVKANASGDEVERVTEPRQERARKRRQVQRRSRTDPESRFLRERGGRFVLGYTGEIAVSEDHFIVAARVTQSEHDAHALVPMMDEVERNCGQRPGRVLADSGFYSNDNVAELSGRGIDVYTPDSNLAHELNGGERATGVGRMPASDPHLLAMRDKLRTPQGRQRYRQRQSIVEPVFGTLKEQRDMRRFRLRGLAKVSIEWTLAALAYNLSRMYQVR